MTSYPATVSEGLRLNTSNSSLSGYAVQLADHAAFNLSLLPKWAKTASIAERLRFQASMVQVGQYHLSVRDRMLMTALCGYQSTAYIVSHLGFSDALSAVRAAVLNEHLSIAAAMSARWYYAASLSERMAFHAEARRSLGATISAQLRLTGSLSLLYQALGQVVDTLRLTGTTTPRLLATVIEKEGLTLSDLDTLKMIYQGQLTEGLDFFLDFVEPSGSITSWATNVRTGAVTEYTNFAFNSFAAGPNGGYVGANSTGLYELIGDQDGSDLVIADMISGLMEMTGSQFTSLQAAYLAVRGSGTFYLKLVAGDGKTYVYEANTKNLQTTRVNIGKGLRARYFTFELISTGQDFDLTSLEFLPIQSTRRV